MRGIGQMAPDGRLDRQIVVEVENARQRRSEFRVGRFHPDRVKMGSDEIPVPQIDSRRHHRSGHHLVRAAVVILVVRTAAGAIGVHQRGLAAPAGASAALRVVRGRRRNVPQIHHVELRDVDAEFHRRRAEQERKRALSKARLAFLAVFRSDLGGVFAGFEQRFEVDEVPVAFDEVPVGLGRRLSDFEQARAVDRPAFPVAGHPSERLRVDLVAFGVPHPLHDPVALQRPEQKPDDAVDFFPRRPFVEI